MMGRCTFCESLLDGSDEHILLSAIGGRKRSRRVICCGHNNEFGSSIDRELADQLASYANLLAIRTGRDGAAPTLRGLQTQDGTRVDLEPGGRPVQKAMIEDVPLGENRRRIRITANSEEQLRRLVESYLKKYGLGQDAAKDGTIEQTLTPLSAPIDFRGSIGGEGPLRAVAKMGLLLLASETGTAAVRCPDISGLRTFIESGGDSTPFVRQDYASAFPRVSALETLPGHSHRICALASPGSGVAVAHVELFGTFCFTVLLSAAWTGPEVALFYGVDPVTGEDVEARTADPPPLSADEFHALATSVEEALKLRLKRLFMMISERQTDIAMQAITDQAVAEVFPPDRKGTPVTAADLSRLGFAMADLLVAHEQRLPYRRSLDPSQVFRPASVQVPNSRRKHRKQ